VVKNEMNNLGEENFCFKQVIFDIPEENVAIASPKGSEDGSKDSSDEFLDEFFRKGLKVKFRQA
jgi:hypothetical protein